MIRNKRNRRGITLIFVISLIVLFMLLGATFAVVSANYLKSAKSNARVEVFRDQPEVALERTLYSILRGRKDHQTAVWPHDLGADIYGYGGFRGRISRVFTDSDNPDPTPASPPAPPFLPVNTGTHIIGIQLDMLNPPTGTKYAISVNADQIQIADSRVYDDGNYLLEKYDDSYNGQILTFLDGPAAGISCRICRYVYDQRELNATASDAVATFYIMLSPGDTATSPFFQGGALHPELVDSTFLVNPQPFSGIGAGASAGGSSTAPYFVGAADPDSPLYINQRNRTPSFAADSYIFGGVNEEYDAADFQNVALGYVTQHSANYRNISVIPSFHRPALLRYANVELGLNGNALRPYFLGPMNGVDANADFPAIDLTAHPSFTNTSTGTIDARNPWQVDNDGDSIRDSIWVDFGLPIQTDSSGRQFKILSAVMVLDMDGRINLNAHGSGYDEFIDGSVTDTSTATSTVLADNVTTSIQRNNRGLGVGPAEISLRALFEDNVDLLAVLNGRNGIPGRYGTDSVPGGDAGTNTVHDFRFFNYPANDVFGGSFRGYFDIFGRFAYGSDQDGSLLHSIPADRTLSQTVNSPYKMRLSAPNGGFDAVDAPFTPAEHERLLRLNDIDTDQLPDRLLQLSDRFQNYDTSTGRNDAYRTFRSVTTESYDVPVPPRDLRAELISRYNNRIAAADTDFLSLQLAGETDAKFVTRMANGLLPTELAFNRRMDLNFPFGDGSDNGTPNGTIDEPSEANLIGPTGEAIGSVPYDHDLDGIHRGNGGDASADVRYAFARKLFVLTLLATNPDAIQDWDGDGSASEIEARKVIAQWVANVVDFRDSDAIMTGIEFDLDPFNGWHVDGDLSTDETTDTPPIPIFPASSPAETSRFVAWGCERPELVITESLVTHDRRTQDITAGGSTNVAGTDTHFDQVLRPRGTLHLEIKNPWNPLSATSTWEVPAELYDNGGVDLSQRVNNAAMGDPVWRLSVISKNSVGMDPDTGVIPAADEERRIYFVGSVNVAVDSGTVGTQVFVPATPGPFLVTPQGVAVLGTSHNVNSGVYESSFGERSDSSRARGIDLNPVAQTVSIFEPGTGAGTARSVSAAIPFSGLNVSESVSYPAGDAMTGLYDLDEPLDLTRADNEFFDQDRTVVDFREIHLQRLANPLQPYDADTNPYRTIDSTTLDMTVFNGTALDSAMQHERDVSGWMDSAVAYEFDTRERGERELPDQATATANMDVEAVIGLRSFWPHEPSTLHLPDWTVRNANDVPDASDTLSYFNYDLTAESLGQDNYSYDTTANAAKFTGGMLAYPIPVFSWNDRPFANAYELMLVPHDSSSQLLKGFSIADENNVADPYNAAVSGNVYGHLLNFFKDSNNSGSATEAFEMFRLFDFVETPSPFVDTVKLLNDTQFQGLQVGVSSTVEYGGLNRFNAPFNYFPTYRWPGLVNVNTLSQRQVLAGLHGKSENSATSFSNGHDGFEWYDFIQARSRTGGTSTASRSGTLSSVLDENQQFPTYFAGIYRSPQNGNKVPALSSANLVQTPVDSTLLRRQVPLGPPSTVPLAEQAMNLTDENADPDRSPIFRQQSLMRLNNLTTTRSNVYAIWITTGYFELDSSGLLGREVGAETGKVERHRMFAIVDRSIPFAYEPGKNHNVDRTILIKRFIE